MKGVGELGGGYSGSILVLQRAPPIGGLHNERCLMRPAHNLLSVLYDMPSNSPRAVLYSRHWGGIHRYIQTQPM